MNPFAIVLSAPSGVGKTTVTKRILAARDDVGYSISCTTRAPRPGEVNGVDYHFIDEATFASRRDRGDFAEWALVHGRLYGTLRSEVQRLLDRGRHVLMDIDVQGAQKFAASFPSCVLVFMLPPSVEALMERLRARNSEGSRELVERLQSAHAELREVTRYHYVLVNDDLEETVASVGAIIDAESLKRERVRALDTQMSELVRRLEQQIAKHTVSSS